ncbi:glucan 1,3-beta-glucosidase A-like isoform X1 [Iris pallida]|uniref:Glucan 1,3-beta-glucosidase A-like isoform X1 n=1 Tax=Iris pallida TaxID=29817 RepID=A0AAX6G0L8_IRIPA|nr:glucan 1,3-beta-glucosidase A-like isoform X1 [Iris pallida]
MSIVKLSAATDLPELSSDFFDFSSFFSDISDELQRLALTRSRVIESGRSNPHSFDIVDADESTPSPSARSSRR